MLARSFFFFVRHLQRADPVTQTICFCPFGSVRGQNFDVGPAGPDNAVDPFGQVYGQI
jgi:hypothetical protein